eukprot:1190736-Prorocentrum_minimum.AAC.3
MTRSRYAARLREKEWQAFPTATVGLAKCGAGVTAMGFTEDLDNLTSLEEREADLNLIENDELQFDGHQEGYGSKQQQNNSLMTIAAFTVIGPLMFGFTLGYAHRHFSPHSRKTRA